MTATNPSPAAIRDLLATARSWVRRVRLRLAQRLVLSFVMVAALPLALLGWANAANTPFREHKMWNHEGGISTPLIVSWPERNLWQWGRPPLVPVGGSITREPGHVIDLLPTFLDLAGAKYPEKLNDRPLTPLPGKSLAPLLLQGRSLGERTLAWEHEGNRAVRVGDWKLVAKTDKYYVKLFEEQTNTRVTVILDTSRSMMRRLASFTTSAVQVGQRNV